MWLVKREGLDVRVDRKRDLFSLDINFDSFVSCEKCRRGA